MGMDLTEEQRTVVEIDGGRHLVLAPPGSGKTEMLLLYRRKMVQCANVSMMGIGTGT